jgi:uncharacterized repeat protein (TIGR01451 family)
MKRIDVIKLIILLGILFILPFFTYAGAEDYDFKLNLTPFSRTIDAGESTHYQVTVQFKGDYDKPVYLSVSGLPTGASGSFTVNPITHTGDGKTKLMIDTLSTTPCGTYTITVTGEEEGGGITHSDQVTLIIENCADPDFSLDASPPQRTINQGETTHYTVTIQALNGFTADVNLSVTGLPSGANGVFQPNPLPITGEAKFKITTTPQVPVGIYTLTITGTAGELSHTAEVILEIKEKPPEPDFTIEVDPADQTVYPGESAGYNIKVTAVNGFSKPVELYVEPLPGGVTADFNPRILKPTKESILTLTTSGSTSLGTYPLTVAARGGGIKRIVKITLTVKERPPEPDFDIKAEPGERTLFRGESTTYTITVNAINGFSGDVSLSVTGVPAGTSASLSETTITPTGTSQLQVITSGDTPLGGHILTITAKGGEKEHSAAVRLEVVCRDFSLRLKASADRGPAPLTVRFEAAVSGGDRLTGPGYSFSWDFGDGSTSVEQNPEHTFQLPGDYRVTVSAVDACGVSKTAAAAIKVEGFDGVISKSFSVSEALPGDEVFITIDIKNKTRFDFTNITVRDELASVLEYLGDTAGVAPRRAGQELEWQFPLLKKSETLSFKINVKVSRNAPQGAVNNTAFLFHDSLGPGRRITSNTASLTINRIEVSLRKQVEQSTAQPGETIKYRLTVRNNSNVPLTGVKLTDELSDYLEFVSTAGGGSLDFIRQGRRLQWEGTLEAQHQEEIVLNARIVSDVFAGTRIENTAKLEAAELKEPITSDTTATAVTAEPAGGKVRFTKRSEVPQTEIGRIIRFSITAANMSDSALIAPVIEDHLPQGFSYVEQTTLLNDERFNEPQGSRRLVWQLPLIKPNETVIIRYQVVIGADVKRGKNVNRAVFRAVDNSGQQISLEASAFVNVSAGGIIFYSGVEGTVYLDRDDDDFYSMADTPLEGIDVRLSTGEKAITNAMGYYLFESLFPGEYAVGINTAVLPEKYRLGSANPQVVILSDGLTDTVDFALKFKNEDEVKSARLEGRVFFDKNKDQVYDTNDPLCEEFKAKLGEQLITNGSKGVFVFSDIEPGTYTVEILYGNKTVKKEIKIEKGNNQVDIPLQFSGIKIIITSEK